jgi:hypothetical protein
MLGLMLQVPGSPRNTAHCCRGRSHPGLPPRNCDFPLTSGFPKKRRVGAPAGADVLAKLWLGQGPE